MSVCVCTFERICILLESSQDTVNGVAMISRLLKIIGLFCKRAL